MHDLPKHSSSLCAQPRQAVISTRPFIRFSDPAERERGSALIVALITIMVLVMISGALVAATARSRATNKTRADRVAGLGPTDAGLSTYRFGLAANIINDATNPKWVPSKDDLTRILDSADGATGEVLPNSQMGPYSVVDSASIPPDHQLTVRELRSDGATGVYDYWQIYKVEAPDAALGKDLRVWFRAWTGGIDPTQSSNARLVVGTFRQGRFSDFQMLSNGPIHFEDGSSIRGPVHSNGDSDGSAAPLPPVPADATIYSDPGAKINCPQPATVTTGVGSVYLPTCKLVGDGKPTGRFISFQGLERTFADMRTRCTADVYCTTVGHQSYTVHLNGRTMVVDGTTIPLDNANGTPRFTAALFDGNVIIDGISKGRFTVGAYNGGANGGTANITVKANLGTQVNPATMVGTVKGDSLGVFAQGDIVLDPSSCASLLHGVFISGMGTMTIGRDLLTSSPPSPMPPNKDKCPQLTLSGAVASNVAPTLKYNFPASGTTIGYLNRTYVWDRALRDAPPPFTPTTGTWEVAEWHDADVSCTNADVSQRPASCD